MIEITVKIGRQHIDTVVISNLREKLFGAEVYSIVSQRNKTFNVVHHPKLGLNALIQHVFSHYAMVDKWRDTPTTEEEI